MMNEELIYIINRFKAMEEETINSIEKHLDSIEKKCDDIDILLSVDPSIKFDQNFKNTVIDCRDRCKENLDELELVMNGEVFEELKERQETIWIRHKELIIRLDRYIEN